MERSPCQDWYDWYFDCLPMAHLRYLEGELGSSNHWRSLKGMEGFTLRLYVSERRGTARAMEFVDLCFWRSISI